MHQWSSEAENELLWFFSAREHRCEPSSLRAYMRALAEGELRQPSGADDVTQDLLLYWHRAGRYLERPQKAQTYVDVAVRMRCNNYRARHRPWVALGPLPASDQRSMVDPPAPILDPTAGLQLQEFLSDPRFSAMVKAAALLRAAGCSWDEIANATGKSAEAIRKELTRALAARQSSAAKE